MEAKIPNQVSVDVDSILAMTHSLHNLTEGIWDQCCVYTAQGVMCKGSLQDVTYEEEAVNSRDWVIRNYGAVAGAICVTRDITQVLSEVVANHHISVTEV